MSDSTDSTSPSPLKKKGGKKIMIAVVAAIVVVALIATVVLGGFLNPNEQTALEKIKSQGKIIMATEATFIPFESFDPTNGTYVGFDIDLANRITENVSAELGVPITLEIRDVAFNTIPASLNNKQIDMSLSGMTITDERNESVMFSTPYYMAEAGFGMLVKTADNSLNSVEALTSASSIVVNTGTTSEIWVQKELVDKGLYPANKVKSLPTIAGCVQDVSIGQSQVFIIDKPTAEEYAGQSSGDLKVSAVIPSYEPYGVALNKEATDLKEIIDRVINTMIENGEMEKLRIKWGLN
ncbi:MAG: amino acid ABC transporter substrate-binding protein [Methanomassiliicoccus sp.]|nr:amino acid ABC transporter substrate-binding protein [Methanomassiliicoccus sp.]